MGGILGAARWWEPGGSFVCAPCQRAMPQLEIAASTLKLGRGGRRPGRKKVTYET